MDSFRTFFLRNVYRNMEKNGDRLAQVEGLLDWEAFRPIASGLYDNKGPKSGRPVCNVNVRFGWLSSFNGYMD